MTTLTNAELINIESTLNERGFSLFTPTIYESMDRAMREAVDRLKSFSKEKKYIFININNGDYFNEVYSFYGSNTVHSASSGGLWEGTPEQAVDSGIITDDQYNDFLHSQVDHSEVQIFNK